jgi:hypothetical protein
LCLLFGGPERTNPFGNMQALKQGFVRRLLRKHSPNTEVIDEGKFPHNTGKIGLPKNKLPLPAP